jgi:farnesyl-diphosphate farnesyltransferase
MRDARDDKRFIDDFIPRVSRTFALAIKFLPPRLRHSVFTAYLLCRVADTIEDSPILESNEKHERLIRLKKILIDASNDRELSGPEIDSLYDSISMADGHDHRLLAQSRQLFDILGRLPRPKQRIIYRWAGEMAAGMAEFSQSPGAGDGVTALADEAEWDRYCYYVAGTVGQMLTELIISEYKIDPDISTRLLQLCNSFGLGLQKVNTIKDVPQDRERGRIYLPESTMRRHSLRPEILVMAGNHESVRAFVFELARGTWKHLDDAIEYTRLVPPHLKGVRMFLTVPIFLAAGTLGAIMKNPIQTMTGPPVKISRRDVARLTAAAGLHSSSNARLVDYFRHLKK